MKMSTPDPDPAAAPLLIVGANGRVGRLLRRSLARRGERAVRYSVRRPEAAGPGDLVWDPASGGGPLRAPAGREGGFAAMLVLAGATPAPGAELGENTRVAAACLAAAREAGIGRVLLPSSAAVYGAGQAGRPFRESDATAPVSDYGRAKLDMERAAEAHRRGGPEVCSLRIGNIVGADALLGTAAAGSRPAEVVLDRFADGAGPIRSYIAPGTLARVLTELARAPSLPDTLNVAAPGRVAMADLLKAAGLAWRWTDAPPTAIQHAVLDTARLEHLVRFRPEESDPGWMVADWRATLEEAA